jgi:hypothetical protein
MMPAQGEGAADVNFRDVFGNFYRHLLRVLPRADFGFLQEAFEKFVVEDWNGVLRRNSRCISFAIRRSTPGGSRQTKQKDWRIPSKARFGVWFTLASWRASSSNSGIGANAG